MAALFLLLLAAAPDAGAGSWKVTFETSLGIDHGNGRIVGTEEFIRKLSPAGIEEQSSNSTAQADPKKPPKVEKSPWKKSEISAERVVAIEALLPRLQGLEGTYKFADDVNDEGWDSKSIVVEVGGKTLRFSLVQGRQHKAMPPPVAELLRLATSAK